MNARREYILAKLRAAGLYARLMANEFDSIGIALKGGFIGDEVALQWAVELGGPDVFGTMPDSLEALEAAE